MAKFVSLLASGVSLGAVVTIVALGFLVLYRATGIVNFAHGDLVTLGAYLALWSISDLGLPTVAGYGLALVLMFVAGVLLERVAHAPLRKRPQVVVIIATLAAALLIRGLLSIWQGNTPQALPSPVGDGSVEILGANVSWQRILIIIVSAIVIGALFLVFQRTSVGRQLRALASDPEMAQLVGIRDKRVSIATFGVSAVMAGLAGILVAPLTAVDLNFGFGLMVLAFVAAVIGGFGDFGGVVVGGLFIGLLQQLIGGYFFPQYADTLPFIALFIVIAIWPTGLARKVGGARL